MLPPLILASTSPYRRALLERLGLPFQSRAPLLDEHALKLTLDRATPVELAQSLALAKAESLAQVEPHAVIIGGDQLVAFEGRVLGKPGTAEAARTQLLSLAGKTHELITAVVVLPPRLPAQLHVDVASLSMRTLRPDEIERYVAADQPIDCAGSYKLEARGISLFDRIDCADHTAITGLPLMWLSGVLRAAGYPVP